MGKVKEYLTDDNGNIRDEFPSEFERGYEMGKTQMLTELNYIEAKLNAIIKDCQATRRRIGEDI